MTNPILERPKRPKIAESITDLIGNTPLVKIKNLEKDLPGEVVGKAEFFNPLASVKDRIAYSMIRTAEDEGLLKPGMTLVEPTSGNTGIGLSFVAASLGYPLVITMPDTMSLERRKLLEAFGTTIHLTPGSEGMSGAVRKAEELAEENSNYLLLQQFKNKANPDAHRTTTALEIWDDCDGKVDVIVAGVGTGGSISGISEVIKELNPNLKVVAVEPEDSPVISGGSPGPHKIQGIGAGFIPDNLNTKIIDEVIKVSNTDAAYTAKQLARKEGILVGISAGANVYAALQVARKQENKGKRIVTILCDTGERYFSTNLFD